MSDQAGASVSGAGDVNGDGLADLVVGARGAALAANRGVGTSYVVFGKADATTVSLAALGSGGFTIEGVAPLDYTGSSVSSAGDVNGDGLADVIIGAPGRADIAEYENRGYSYVVFSQETPPLSATFKGRSRNGDASTLAVGVTGDGSNESSPDARLWIDFADGADPVEQASLETVSLNRTQVMFNSAAAPVNWLVQTTRDNWSEVTLKFRYLESEIISADELELRIYFAPSPEGPFTSLPSVIDTSKNTLSVVARSLGYFAIGEGESDLIFTNGYE